MKVCAVKELVNQNFNVIFVNALQQFWHTTKSFQCFGNPKKQNLFLFLNGCKITYTDKNAQTLVANSGDIVYTPIGSEYRAILHDFSSENSHTVGINFLLYDEASEPIILSDKIKIFHLAEPTEVLALRTLNVLSNQNLAHSPNVACEKPSA